MAGATHKIRLQLHTQHTNYSVKAQKSFPFFFFWFVSEVNGKFRGENMGESMGKAMRIGRQNGHPTFRGRGPKQTATAIRER